MEEPELVRAMVMYECDPIGGSSIPGTGKLATPFLEQNEYWRTADGRLLLVDDMEPAHRENVLRWMERYAYILMLNHDTEWATGPLAPRGDMASLAFESMLEEEWMRPPLERLKETAMYKRIAWLVERDKVPSIKVRKSSSPRS